MELTYEELYIIECILRERQNELSKGIGKTTDEMKYIQLSQLVGKVNALLHIKKKQDDKEK